MPLVLTNGCHTFYRLDGPDEAPVVVLAHSLGLDHTMWDPQASDLSRHFRVLRYDIRGHGASSTTPGDYTVDQLALDVLALADALGLSSFAIAGVSLGGLIGLSLGAQVPERLTHLVVASSSAKPDASAMEARRQAVLQGGMDAVQESVIARFFSPHVVRANPPVVAAARRTLRSTSPVGYVGCAAALRDADFVPVLDRITVPSLVIGTDADPAMPWAAHGHRVATTIPGAKTVMLKGAHISNLESPRAFGAALFDFLLPPADDVPAAGMKVRRATLGDDYVDAAVAATTDFTRAFQHYVTQNAWGALWARPSLPPSTRRYVTLAICASLGRWDEFRLHVRTGLTHELEACDLEEILLQVAVYAGIPAANTAFHVAREEMANTPKL